MLFKKAHSLVGSFLSPTNHFVVLFTLTNINKYSSANPLFSQYVRLAPACKCNILEVVWEQLNKMLRRKPWGKFITMIFRRFSLVYACRICTSDKSPTKAYEKRGGEKRGGAIICPRKVFALESCANHSTFLISVLSP